jgi:hypothetical protein
MHEQMDKGNKTPQEQLLKHLQNLLTDAEAGFYQKQIEEFFLHWVECQAIECTDTQERRMAVFAYRSLHSFFGKINQLQTKSLAS